MRIVKPLLGIFTCHRYVIRYLTRAGRYLQKQAGDRFWYEKDTQEACKLLFARASEIRKEFGIIPPD